MRERRSFSAGRPRGLWLVVGAAVAVAAPIGATALGLPPPISGRLHPGLAPSVLAGVVLIAAFWILWRPSPQDPAAETAEEAGPGLKPLLAAALAVGILAFGVRTLGVALASFLAASVAAAGVVGVSPLRALRIGLGLALGVGLLFSLMLRQPLPVLPPGFPL